MVDNKQKIEEPALIPPAPSAAAEPSLPQPGAPQPSAAAVAEKTPPTAAEPEPKPRKGFFERLKNRILRLVGLGESDDDAPKREMSKGEKWYNRIVYSVLNYWVNLGMSLYIADLFMHGGKADPSRLINKEGWFNRRFNENNKWIGDNLGAVLPPEIASRATKVAVGTFTLNSGGNILLIPLKWLEDAKRPIVHWLNKHVFGEKQLAPDGHEETAKEIYIEQEQPQQSWGRVIGRRALATAATITTGLALDWAFRTGGVLSKVFKGKNAPALGTMDGTDNLTSWVVRQVNWGLNKVGGGVIAENKTVQRYIGYAALDWMYTVITSQVMHLTNGAKKARMPGEIGDDFDPPGISTLDEIKLVPEPGKEAKANPKADITPSSFDKKRGGYSSGIKPTENHTELAKGTEAEYSVAP